MKEKQATIFSNSHEGLCRLTSEAGLLISRTDFNNTEAMQQCITVLLQATRFYCYHVNHVSQVIYGALREVAPYIIALMDKANEEGMSLALTIRDRIREYNRDPAGQNRIGLGIELESLVFSFTSLILQQVEKEKTVLLEIILSLFDEKQLADLEKQIQDHFQPEENHWFYNRAINSNSTRPQAATRFSMNEHKKQDPLYFSEPGFSGGVSEAKVVSIYRA